jgi:sodium/proline symporter
MDYTLIGFVLYLAMILVIGIITFRLNKSHSDYFLGGRRMGPVLVAFSERTSAESAWLLVGLPGAAMAVGLMEVWTAIGCVSGIVLSWIFIAKDLRISSEKHSAITLPNFFAEKFSGQESKVDDRVLRITATIIILFFFTFYLAAQFIAAGKVLFVTFDIPQENGIILGATVIIIYTMMGGFLAVVWTDLIQGIIMIGALVILPIIGFIVLESRDLSIAAALAEAGPDVASLVQNKTGWAAAAVVISGLSWGLGYFGQPHLITKYMSIGDPEKMKVARRIAISWAVPAFTGAMLIGLVSLALYGQNFYSDPEYVMPGLANDLLPAWLAGIFISGAIAAMMSTADSQLLIISSSVIEDFYHKTLGREVSEKLLLNLSRIITLVVGIFGLIIALMSKELIFAMVSYAWSGLGASFGPGIILLLKWKRCTKEGVLAGMIAGSVTTVVWSNIDYLDDIISVRFVAFALATIAVIVFSLVSKKK